MESMSYDVYIDIGNVYVDVMQDPDDVIRDMGASREAGHAATGGGWHWR